jgi:hypothetical protein
VTRCWLLAVTRCGVVGGLKKSKQLALSSVYYFGLGLALLVGSVPLGALACSVFRCCCFSFPPARSHRYAPLPLPMPMPMCHTRPTTPTRRVTMTTLRTTRTGARSAALAPSPLSSDPLPAAATSRRGGSPLERSWVVPPLVVVPGCRSRAGRAWLPLSGAPLAALALPLPVTALKRWLPITLRRATHRPRSRTNASRQRTASCSRMFQFPSDSFFLLFGLSRQQQACLPSPVATATAPLLQLNPPRVWPRVRASVAPRVRPRRCRGCSRAS